MRPACDRRAAVQWTRDFISKYESSNYREVDIIIIFLLSTYVLGA